MSFILKSFPTEISNYIELPDIGELLTYPIFFDTDIDSAYKNASDFQRKLIDMTPIRGNKKNISVLSQVRILTPKSRSCTGYVSASQEDPFNEWHIDCEENEDGEHIYQEERDIVHLLTNECTSMTEFNDNMVEINIPSNVNYNGFLEYLRNNRDLVVPKKMPHNKIVTFTNHLHRATDPKRIEFKYMFRIVETDRNRLAKEYNPNYATEIIDKNGRQLNIEQSERKITIFVPDWVRESGMYPPFNLSNNKGESSIKDLEIEHLYWEDSGISIESDLMHFTDLDTIMVILKDQGENNLDEINKALEIMSGCEVTLSDPNGNKIFGQIQDKRFANYESNYNRIIHGTYIKFTEDESEKIQYGVEYTVKIENYKEYKFVVPNELRFVK